MVLAEPAFCVNNHAKRVQDQRHTVLHVFKDIHFSIINVWSSAQLDIFVTQLQANVTYAHRNARVAWERVHIASVVQLDTNFIFQRCHALQVALCILLQKAHFAHHVNILAFNAHQKLNV